MAGDLDLHGLERALAGIAGPVRLVEVTGSTNSDALDWAAEGAPEKAVVVADYQTAGRGRWGRSWEAPPGSALLFSLVLRPRPDTVSLLTTLAGVACAEGLRNAAGLEPGLKWPNDVILSGRKVAGILVETRVVGAGISAAVVGMGINVFSRPDDFSPEVAATATSLAVEMEASGRGEPPGRAELLAAILEQFGHRYGEWSPPHLLEEATGLSVVLGHAVRLRRPRGDVIEGVATGLTADGALEIESGGSVYVVDSGEVQRLSEP